MRPAQFIGFAIVCEVTAEYLGELLTYDVDTDVLEKAKKRLRLAPTTRVLYVVGQ